MVSSLLSRARLVREGGGPLGLATAMPGVDLPPDELDALIR